MNQFGDFYVRIELHSISPADQELCSFVVTYPRSILPEFNTHTVISKNTSSSRAIPYARKGERKEGQPPSMREMVLENPYLPLYWGRNEAGMQASSELTADEIASCKEEILAGRDHMVWRCDRMWAMGMHKQDINRYLEPWGWTTQILTSTHWSNFFALRTHKDAHPAFRKIARWMYILYKKSVPVQREWHLPFTDHLDDSLSLEDRKKVSVSRCARLSYNTFDGVRSLEKDFELYEKLAGGYPKHMSPFGHQGCPGTGWSGNFYGWKQLRKEIPNENISSFEVSEQELLEWTNANSSC